jgi:hypothetical protein
MGVYPHGAIDLRVSSSQSYRLLIRFHIDPYLDDPRHSIRFGPTHHLVAVEVQLAKMEMAIRKGSLSLRDPEGGDGCQSTTFDPSSPANPIPSSSISFSRSLLVASP